MPNFTPMEGQFYTDTDIVKETNTSTARLRLLTNGIVHYSFLPDVIIDVPQHMENHAALVKLCSGNLQPILVDASEIINITPEARQAVKTYELLGPTLCRAYVTASLGHKMLISIFLKINKPTVPNKVFSNYVDAEKWLLEQSINEELKHQRA